MLGKLSVIRLPEGNTNTTIQIEKKRRKRTKQAIERKMNEDEEKKNQKKKITPKSIGN